MSDYTPMTEDVRWGYAELNQAAQEAFDRWLARYTAEKRAEWEAEQGTEEPEWEYGVRHESHHAAGEDLRTCGMNCVLLRRRKAGPWMPVEQGETTKTEGNRDEF